MLQDGCPSLNAALLCHLGTSLFMDSTMMKAGDDRL